MTAEKLKKKACKIIDTLQDQLLYISNTLHANPELMFEEIKAMALLSDAVESEGLEVQRGVYGLKTAFQSEFGSKESPCVAILAEYDALPDIGHACGHNLIATAALGAGLCLAKLSKQLPGRIRLLGTPAEEGGGGKILMAQKGAFKNVDAAMMVHPGNLNLITMPTLAATGVEVVYHGKAAHASAAPEKGINALDALLLAFHGINALRQHLTPTDKIHGIITDGGQAVNIIPERAGAKFSVRSSTSNELALLKQKVQNCLEAGATATGATAKIVWAPGSYLDLKTNWPLAEQFEKNAQTLERNFFPLEQVPIQTAGSTDMGNVSHIVPSIHPMFASAPEECTLHHSDFAKHAGSKMGEAAAIDAAKCMAMTAIDYFMDTTLQKDVKNHFANTKNQVK